MRSTTNVVLAEALKYKTLMIPFWKPLKPIEDHLNMTGTGTSLLAREHSPSVGKWQPSEEDIEAILWRKAAILDDFIRSGIFCPVERISWF